MKELSRFEIATVKRTAHSVKGWRGKKAKLVEKRDAIQAELDTIERAIEKFEAPIVELTGGFTSEQVLNGDMDMALTQLVAATSIDVEPQTEGTQGTQEAEEAITAPGGIPLFGNTTLESGKMPFED